MKEIGKKLKTDKNWQKNLTNLLNFLYQKQINKNIIYTKKLKRLIWTIKLVKCKKKMKKTAEKV